MIYVDNKLKVQKEKRVQLDNQRKPYFKQDIQNMLASLLYENITSCNNYCMLVNFLKIPVFGKKVSNINF